MKWGRVLHCTVHTVRCSFHIGYVLASMYNEVGIGLYTVQYTLYTVLFILFKF